MEEETDLLSISWSTVKILELVKDINFKELSDIEEIDLYESIIPLGCPTTLDEETIKNKGEKWIIHKYDLDPFPCLPHAHNVKTNYKLDLRNGIFYKKKKQMGSIGKKELESFRSKVIRISLPPLQV